MTHTTVPCVQSIPVLIMGPGPEPKAIDETTGSTRGLNPKGFTALQNILLYQDRFCSVRPKRRKNAKAKIGLTHWENLMSKIVHHPSSFHSSDVAVGMIEKPPCMAFHPGQKLASPPNSKSGTSPITPTGIVMITSKPPSTRSLKNLLRSIDALLARAPFRSLLCLKYVNINLAEGSQQRIARVLFILTRIQYERCQWK